MNALIIHDMNMVQILEITSDQSPETFSMHDLTFRTRLPKWKSDISNMSRLVPRSEGMCGIGWKCTATVNRLETESYLKVINVIAGVNNIFLERPFKQPREKMRLAMQWTDLAS